MTFRIPASQVPANFAELVEAHRQDLLAHRFTINEPAPSADVVVEACVTRVRQGDDLPDDFVADFEIFDDSPPLPPPKTLRERQNELREAVNAAAQVARDAVMTPGKLQLLALQFQRATQTDPALENEANRAIVDQYTEVTGRMFDISLQAAEQAAAIDDLTEETIVAWEVKPLTEA